MSKQVTKKIHTVYHKGRKQVARAVYSLPGLERRNPRRKLVTFKDHCGAAKSFPGNSALPGKDWYLKLQPAQTVRRQSPLCLDDAEAEKFREQTLKLQGGNEFLMPETFLACVHNARLVSPNFLVLTADSDILLESAFSSQEVLEKSGILDAILPSLSRPKIGSYCLLASPWSGKNYYHWLLDALPRLSLIEQFEELNSARLIVPQKLKSFQRDSLRLAGVTADRLAGFDGGSSQYEKLFYPELLSPTGNPSARAVTWLRERFLPKVPASSRRRLYVTRRDATERRIINEPALIRALEARGFETVCPGDLTFADQIKLFSEAAVVVGAHGAGLSNMVFAPADATLIELFGDNYINGCFWVVANLLGQKHAFLTGPSERLEYSIAPERLHALLDQVGGVRS